MDTFAERLRSEIDYIGLTHKEFAAKAGIKKRALDMYIGAQQSMPSADTAVKIAQALGVSVEYLVTGKDAAYTLAKYRAFLDDISMLPDDMFTAIKTLVRVAARRRK
jgi:transcriptional regulator with XRE-family HTH domain